MAKKTKFIVYVPAETLNEPSALFDAVLSHMILKEYPIPLRRKFMREFMHANTPVASLAIINDWVQVRDVATFPFKKKGDAEEAAENAAEAIAKSGITSKEAAEALTPDAESEEPPE